jgi:hypothetical protein
MLVFYSSCSNSTTSINSITAYMGCQSEKVQDGYKTAQSLPSSLGGWSGGGALHRLVAASVLNRDLEPGEVAHHLNGDKTDNRPENLRVLPSQRNHTTLEHLERRHARGIEPLFEAEKIFELLK